ncbi:MAG: flagellar type III secretion system pore protein FliP [Gemmataceae bacterium]
MGDLVEHLNKSGALQDLPPALQTALFLGGLVLLPTLLVCITGFTRIVIVLSFVRRAVTSQDIPPNLVVLGLSFFLTWFVMGTTLEEINEQAVTPYLDGKMPVPVAVQKATDSLRKFMLAQTRRQDLALFLSLSKVAPPEAPEDVPLRVLVPAFIISEMKTAFIMGFCIYLPFLLVDLVVASILTAMGMVMMPPVMISAPFKILLFVVADGWHLVTRALSVSFG